MAVLRLHASNLLQIVQHSVQAHTLCCSESCFVFAAEADVIRESPQSAQGQQPLQGLPSLCPPAEEELQAAPAKLQQAGPSAELVDGYQLHITGDAIDALQSPICASAQVHAS